MWRQNYSLKQNMYCKHCGKKNVEESKFCPFCGKDLDVKNQNNSGVNEITIPEEIKGWSWGGFLWGWIWAIGNKTWIGLLALVPYIGLIMNIILGIYGREWAWRNKKWDSIEHFKKVQRNWAKWWLILLGGGLIFIPILSVAILSTINPIEQSNKAKDATIKNDLAELMNASERYYAVKDAYPWNDKQNLLTDTYVSEDITRETWLANLVKENELSQNFIDKIKTLENKLALIKEEGKYGNSYYCFQPNSKSVKEEAKTKCSTVGSFTYGQSKYLCVTDQEYLCLP